MANTMTEPVDMSGMSEREILMHMISAFLMHYKTGQMSSDYYCGITGDILANLSRHEVAGYTMCIECGAFDIAAKIEEHLYHLGFDIGNPNNKAGNGGNQNSTIVYMIEKDTNYNPQ